MRGLKTLNKIIILLIFLFILFYGYSQSKKLFQGPQITIQTPQPNATVYKIPVVVKGRISRASFISLNDKQIYTDINGYFEEKLISPLGYNIITLKVKDNLGKEKIKSLQYIVKNKKSLNINNND